jgi:3-oxoacyl-[acyl-carrier protein] reductase
MGMMKNLATNLAAWNISVNDVAPAMVGGTGLLPNADGFPGLVESIPLHRLCEPEEVANAVTFYARTGFATGQSFVIAGGLR